MTPDTGDILHLQFDPATGQEMKGPHFCLVVSPKPFNQRFKLAWVCPISGGMAEVARNSGFLVSLMGTGLKTTGNIHVHQIKSLDWNGRNAKLVERAPLSVVNEVRDCLLAVMNP